MITPLRYTGTLIKVEPIYPDSKWDYRLFFEYGQKIKPSSPLSSFVEKQAKRSNVNMAFAGYRVKNKSVKFSLVAELQYPLSKLILDKKIVPGDKIAIELFAFTSTRIFEGKTFYRPELRVSSLAKYVKGARVNNWIPKVDAGKGLFENEEFDN